MTVLYVVTALLAVLGLSELIGAVICHITSCKTTATTLTAFIEDEDCCELAVRGIIENIRWSHFSPDKILIVTADFSDEAIEDIETMISGYPEIELCRKKDCKFPI